MSSIESESDPDSEGSDSIFEAEIGEEPVSSGKKGFLVYLFSGEQSQAEIVVFRRICMKFGLQAWDEMERYLPWRNRSAFRTTLCRIIRKQAVSEYVGIKADPFEIQKDNPLDFSLAEDYTIKAGMLVNQKWDRSAGEWDELRNQNVKKYGLSDEEADTVEIPNIVSIEFMRQSIDNRRQSLILKRAALRNELARRKGETHVDLGVQDLILVPSESLTLPVPHQDLETSSPSADFYCEVDDPDLEL